MRIHSFRFDEDDHLGVVSRLRVVPLDYDGERGTHLITFDYKFSEVRDLPGGFEGHHRVAGRWIRMLHCDDTFEEIDVIGEIENSDLIDAVPVDPAGRSLVLGSTVEETRRRGSRRAYTRNRYWLEDPLSGDRLDDLLAQTWTGKLDTATYRPMALGGRSGVGATGWAPNAVIVALREERHGDPDSVQVTVVALNVAFDQSHPSVPEVVIPIGVTGEVILFAMPLSLAAWTDLERAAQVAVTPVARNNTDGWVAAFTLGGPVLVSRLQAGVTAATPPTVLSTPPPVRLADLKIAGGMYQGAVPVTSGQRSSYLAAYTNIDTDGRRYAWGTTFDWNGTSASPSAARSRRYPPTSSLMALIDDRATSSHWYLATQETPDDSSMPAWPFIRPADQRPTTRLALIGHDARIYRRWPADSAWRPVALGFDGRRKRAVIGGSQTIGAERSIELAGTGHATHVMAVPGMSQDCAVIAAGLPARIRESHRPFAGHRFFTVRLSNGPPSNQVELVVSLRMDPDAELCTLWIPIDATTAETYNFTTTTDASGNASHTFPLSADSFPLSFPGRDDPEFTNVIQQRDWLFVAQWRWFGVEGLAELVTSGVDFGLFDWSDGLDLSSDEELSGRVEIRRLVSNPMLLFVAP